MQLSQRAFLPRALVLTFALMLLSALAGCSPDNDFPANDFPDYDLLLSGGTVVDGTGKPPFTADIAIVADRIAKIAEPGSIKPGNSVVVVDVTGLVIAPGFIDTHSHADGALDDPATAGIKGFLKQGVTTALYGVDGHKGVDHIRKLQSMEGAMGVNAMSYVGHNAVRGKVLGMENRAPNDQELAAMQALVTEGMELGAAGLSSGLMYLPGNFATTEEVIELARVAAPYDGSYDSHVRDPAKNLLASHQECLDIAFAAGVRAHPGHVKAVGGLNFGKGPDFVKLIEAGIARGQDVTVDLYPYDGAATAPIVATIFPGDDEHGRVLQQRLLAAFSGEASEDDFPALLADVQNYWKDNKDNAAVLKQAQHTTENPPDGVFSWIKAVGYESMRMVVSENPEYIGRMMTDLAAEQGLSPFQFFVEVVASEGAKAMVTLGAIQEDDIRVIMTQPWAMISSDGAEVGVQHPRDRGTFPRVLGRYVREWGVLTLEEAVHKISGLPAAYLHLKDRGVIAETNVADITVFNPATVIDRSTWSEPDQYADGIVHVLIGGEFALRDGEVTPERLGRFIAFEK